VGSRLRILPPGAPASTDGRLDLVIPRGAFGSGEHETTASCLEALEDLPQVRGARCLDLGSGTGILAIAALRLGAEHAVCADTDPAAVAVAERTCRLNGVEDRVRHVCGALADVHEAGFDLVLANLYADVLLAVADDLVRRARPGGLLLLSGIPWEDGYAVRQRYEALACRMLRSRSLEEYTTLLLEHAPRH
jgi:ribosomal protein L11 methyltransferase